MTNKLSTKINSVVFCRLQQHWQPMILLSTNWHRFYLTSDKEEEKVKNWKRKKKVRYLY